jgi:UDP-N-acetylglucosamine acyltransferase
MKIHPTAVVDAAAELAADVEVGPYAVISGPVRLGAGTTVGAHAVIEGRTVLGAGCRVFPHAVLGTIPQDLKFAGEDTTLEVGAGTTFREFVSCNRGTRATGTTRIGGGCLLMAYAHVAHDCVLGDGVVLANCATLAGHVDVGEYASVGGLAAVHQFTHIGRYAYIGGMGRISQDVIPYGLVGGEPTKVIGINVIGLKRRGFSSEVLEALRRAYHILFREELNTSQALAKIKTELPGIPEVEELTAFVNNSERGILK